MWPYREWQPDIGRGVWIDPSAVVIGRVSIGDDSSVWPGAVIRGDVNFIRIGARSSIQDGSVLHVASARLVRALEAQDIAHLAESAAHYIALKSEYLAR